MTTWTCIATIERQDGTVAFKTWRGKRGAAKLKSAMRIHFRNNPSIKHYSLGNCFSVNSYGAH